MRAFFYILTLCLWSSCHQQRNDFTSLSTYKIVFDEVSDLLNSQESNIWGVPLMGPMLIVDKDTRQFVSNREVQGMHCNDEDGLWVGQLSEKINASNTAISWNDMRWTMVLAPLPLKRVHRDILITHELFHRIQPQLGFDNLKESDNSHLDRKDGRIFLRLEINALKAAITSEDIESSLAHLEWALHFRSKRYELFPDARLNENSLELNEGLAEYTGIIAGTSRKHEARQYLTEQLEEAHLRSSFVRSFAYFTLPAYGFVLHQLDPMWHTLITEKTILTDLIAGYITLHIDRGQALNEMVIFDYGLKNIKHEEDAREKLRQSFLGSLRSVFADKNALQIPLKSMNVSFNPNEAVPIEGIGTIYPSMRLTDVWGILEVHRGGGLILQSWDTVVVRPLQVIDNHTLSGEGWELHLAENWIWDPTIHGLIQI